ncbi:hypothetical protein [Photobacterium sp. GSS17]|uniref:hypothetical protein n=1 Tax=Photobacterium sp. GSS17 TaxID=3020715 RepID=UPI0023616AD3|nr:hypothetical protein [Photobacterium sp. GSS17]
MCKYCGVKSHDIRIKRQFWEKSISHRNQQKFRCTHCQRTYFVPIGGQTDDDMTDVQDTPRAQETSNIQKTANVQETTNIQQAKNIKETEQASVD